MSLLPYTKLGVWAAAATFAVDQGHKWWMLGPFNIAERQPVRVAPFFDLVLAWNRGVSYGWFATSSQTGRWILVALMATIVAVLAVWLFRATDRISGLSLGFLIGGALGNILDRIVHGAVADFFFFHVGSFQWYVFNLADVAIVAGVAGLLYSSWRIGGPSGEATTAE